MKCCSGLLEGSDEELEEPCELEQELYELDSDEEQEVDELDSGSLTLLEELLKVGLSFWLFCRNGVPSLTVPDGHSHF